MFLCNNASCKFCTSDTDAMENHITNCSYLLCYCAKCKTLVRRLHLVEHRRFVCAGRCLHQTGSGFLKQPKPVDVSPVVPTLTPTPTHTPCTNIPIKVNPAKRKLIVEEKSFCPSKKLSLSKQVSKKRPLELTNTVRISKKLAGTIRITPCIVKTVREKRKCSSVYMQQTEKNESKKHCSKLVPLYDNRLLLDTT